MFPGAIPVDELRDADFEWRGGAEANFALQVIDIGPGGFDIPGLHGKESFFGGLTECVFEDFDEAEQFDGAIISNVVDAEGCRGGAARGVWCIGAWCGDVVAGADHAFDDVIDVGEVAFHVTEVEDINGFSGEDGFGEKPERHIRASPGAIDGEEAESGGGEVEEVAVGMGHEFVGAFGGGIEADGVVDRVFNGEGNFFIRAVDAA
ncbi:MAG: hypothetical protein RL215_2961 [Planctomycetota bacterium]